MNQVLLNGIELSDLLTLFKEIVKSELQVLLSSKHVDRAYTPKLLTSKETAKLLSVSLVTLHDWKLSGKIPYIKIGTRVRFEEQEVLRAIKEGGTVG